MSKEKIGKLIEAMEDHRFYSITDDNGQPFLTMTPIKGRAWKLWYRSMGQAAIADIPSL